MCSMRTVLAVRSEPMELTRDCVVIRDTTSCFLHVSENGFPTTSLYTPRPMRGENRDFW